MAKRIKSITFNSIILTILFIIPIVISDDATPIPKDKAQVEAWFTENVGPLDARKATLDPALVTAEAAPKTITVPGEFKTVQAAIDSVPKGNKNRVIISISPGKYTEKITIAREKPFITLYGTDPKNQPELVFNGDAAKYGTVESATVSAQSDYFSAVNINFVNSSPMPDGRPGAQAVALTISGDKASFYNCKFHGFQDTLCDSKGKHFFKDCYIEGTVDFIFGDGKSIYLNSEIHVVEGSKLGVIAAQARKGDTSDTGYSFVHCSITGSGKFAHLGRAWMQYARSIYAYSDIGDAVNPEGWSNANEPSHEKTVFFGEFSNTGTVSDLGPRVPYTKKLTEAEAKEFLSLAFIEGSKWLLPPAQISNLQTGAKAGI